MDYTLRYDQKCSNSSLHLCNDNDDNNNNQGRQTRPNLGGVEEVAKIDANIHGSIFKKLHLLPYIRKAIKRGLFLH